MPISARCVLQVNKTHDKCLVVLFKLVNPAVSSIGSHGLAKRPLILRLRVRLEKGWRDEGFKNEPTTKIDTGIGMVVSGVLCAIRTSITH
jgi:hypothetical protein